MLFRALNDMDEVDFMDEENEVRLAIKQTLIECLRLFDGIDEKIRETLGSYSRKIVEGSAISFASSTNWLRFELGDGGSYQ